MVDFNDILYFKFIKDLREGNILIDNSLDKGKVSIGDYVVITDKGPKVVRNTDELLLIANLFGKLPN